MIKLFHIKGTMWEANLSKISAKTTVSKFRRGINQKDR